MSERVIRISPDGKEVQFLTNGDDFPIGSPKTARIVRASHVRFCNDEKKWFVWLRSTDGEGKIQELKQLPGFDSRGEAIEAERVFCNNLLEDTPSFVDNVFYSHVKSCPHSN